MSNNYFCSVMTPALITREGKGNTSNMHKHVTTQHAVNLDKCKEPKEN